jgi:hypothetical protein
MLWPVASLNFSNRVRHRLYQLNQIQKMHCPYFVKLSKDEGLGAREAINKALSLLEENNFAGNEGYWGGGKGDWFVMGGRWSGLFSGLLFNGNFHDEVLALIRSKEPDSKERDFVTDDDCNKYADEIQQLWLSLGGKNNNFYARDQYKRDGYDDDAIPLTAEVIDALKRKFPEGVEYFDHDAFEEKGLSSLGEQDIGEWLAVVDYHF